MINYNLTRDALITESLRERCIYNNLSDKKKYKWFEYARDFISLCIKTDPIYLSHYNEECSARALRNLSIPEETIKTCVDSSFVNYGNWSSDNLIFREDSEMSRLIGIYHHPSLTINNFTYRGNIEGKDVFYSICAGFQSRPNICVDNYWDN
jgi:hypothetical protein